MTSLFELVELQEDTQLYREVMRLHQFTVLGRWCFVLALWLTIGLVSIWLMLPNIRIMVEYFTWASVRTAFRYNYWPGIGLMFCIAVTFSVLLWQSRNIIFGLPLADQKRLVERVLKIRKQGKTHPLWQWVCDR